MDVKMLRLGSQLEIKVSRNQSIYHMTTKIEAVREMTIFVTLVVGRSGEPFHFQPTDEVEVIYREGERLWKWNVAQADFAKLDNDLVHAVLLQTEEGTPYNRREVFRVFLGEYIEINRRVPDMAAIREYRMSHPEIRDINQLLDVEECYKTITVPGIIKDLSETGVGLYSSEKFPADSELYIMLTTPYGVLNCMCTPVRSEIDEISQYRYFYGCKIMSVGNNITQILNKLQRQKLR